MPFDVVKPRDQRTPLLLLEHTLIPFLLLHFSIVLSANRPWVRWLGLPLVLGSYARPVFTATSTHWGVAFLCGVTFFYEGLTATNYLLFTDVFRDVRFRYENDAVDPAGLPFLKRNVWVFNLLMSHRGVGRNFRPRGVAEHRNTGPGSEHDSRAAFFKAASFRALCCYLYLDFFSTFVIGKDPFFATPGCWKSLSPFVSTGAERVPLLDGRCYPAPVSGLDSVAAKLLYTFLRQCSFTFEVYSVLTNIYDFVSIVAVCVLRVDEPKNWPPLFGPLSSIFSGRNAGLRNFWGKFWHQSFRLQMSLPSEAACRFLLGDDGTKKQANSDGDAKAKRQQSSLRAKQNGVKVLTTFANSGLLHLTGCFLLGISGVGSFAFFFSQGLGVLLEESMLRLLFPSVSPANAREKKAGRVVSIAWMVLWFLATGSFFMIDLVNGGTQGGKPATWSTPLSFWRVVDGEGLKAIWRWGGPSGWWQWDQSAGVWGIKV